MIIHTLFPLLCVWGDALHLCVQMRGYRHLCTTVHVWRSKDNLWCRFLSFTLLDTGSLLFLLHTPLLLVCKLLAILVCPQRSIQIIDVHTTVLGFARVLGIANLYTCKSVLPTELRPQPQTISI